MKRIVVVGLLALSAPAWACQKGWVLDPAGTGVCMESSSVAATGNWASDEKPPEDKMPSWQREGVKQADVKNMALDDEKADREKAEAEAEGKKAAGLK